jgi:hypothetical protein
LQSLDFLRLAPNWHRRAINVKEFPDAGLRVVSELLPACVCAGILKQPDIAACGGKPLACRICR